MPTTTRSSDAASTSCTTRSCPSRCPRSSGARSSSWRPRGVHVQQLPRGDRRPSSRRQHDRRDPAHERRPGRTARRMGGREADRARGRRTHPGVGSAAQSGGAGARVPRPLRPRAAHRRARRGPPLRDAGRRRPRHRATVHGVEARARRVARGALRLHGRRAAALAPRRPLLPGRARGGRDRARPPVRGRRHRSAHHAHLRRARARSASRARPQRPVRARRQEPARVLHRHRPRG